MGVFSEVLENRLHSILNESLSLISGTQQPDHEEDCSAEREQALFDIKMRANLIYYMLTDIWPDPDTKKHSEAYIKNFERMK